MDKQTQHIGAVAFIYRFGSSLNEHVHFHVYVVDGVVEEVAGDAGVCIQAHDRAADKRGTKVDELMLTSLALIDRIAALFPPPRTHCHRHFGVLAPNSPLRAAVVAMAAAAQQATVQAEPAIMGEDTPTVTPLGNAVPTQPEIVPPKRSPTHYLWAVLISGKYSTTSGLSQSPRTSPRHAGRRCGMNMVMRRWARGSKPSQTGIWRRDRHPTMIW